MSEEGPSQKKRWIKKGNNEDDTPLEHEGDSDNKNIAKDIMDITKRSSPRRKYLRETGSGVSEKIDKKGKNKGDCDSSEEAEAGDDLKSKPSKSEDEEYSPEPPSKRRRTVRLVQESVSGGETSQVKKSKSKKGRKGPKKRARKRITPKKSKASKKKAKVEEDESEYEVEKIVKVKILKNGKKEFLIRWKGFSEESDTWEPESNLTCKELVNQYFEEHKEEIEAPVEEEKKRKMSKRVRRGSSRPSGAEKPDSAADEEGSGKGNANKGKGSSKRSRGKGKKRQTRARNAAAKSEKDEAAVTDSENDEGEGTSQNTGDSREAGKPSDATGPEGRKEYEVEEIIAVRRSKNGRRQFFIKWRGYSCNYNTWEAEEDMNCDEEIERYLNSEEAKKSTQRQLRVVRPKTNRYVPDGGRGRKMSERLGKMPRKSYSEID